MVIDRGAPGFALLEVSRRSRVERGRAGAALHPGQPRQEERPQSGMEGESVPPVGLHETRVALGESRERADVGRLVQDRAQRGRCRRREDGRPQEEPLDGRSLGLEQIVEHRVAAHPAARQLTAPLDEPRAEQAANVKAERRALDDELLARPLAQSQERRVDEGDDAGRAGCAGEDGDLAETLTGAENGDALDVARGVAVKDLDGARLHDVEGVPGIGLAEDDGSRRHPDLVELAGDSRQIFARETREDRRAGDRLDEFVHGRREYTPSALLDLAFPSA